MTLFEVALKAKIPVVGVQYDDIVNFLVMLERVAGRKVMILPLSQAHTVGSQYIYWTDSVEKVTVDLYRKFCQNEATLVVLNPDKTSSLIFHAGTMPTPEASMRSYLEHFVAPEMMPAVLNTVSGMTLKGGTELIQLTMARTGSVAPKAIRETKMLLGGHTPGLETLEPFVDPYVMQPDIQQWLTTNTPYFLNPQTPLKLVPRGLMVTGEPGVGKSTLAGALSHLWSVPAYRMDVSALVNRFLGEAERRLAHNLYLVEQNSPCILLFDEIEKLFRSLGDEGTIGRLLSQLLWWLGTHQAKVFVVMTSNDLTGVPKELYRPGRIDRKVEIKKLPVMDARVLVGSTFMSLTGQLATEQQLEQMYEALGSKPKPHADVIRVVIDLIKEKGWLTNG